MDSFTVDEVLNAVDSLETASSFLRRPDPYKWKWIAISLDHAFYGFCVSAVAIHDPINVLKGIDDEGHMFERPGQGWKKSKRIYVKDCRHAYRIKWEPCDPPAESFAAYEPFPSTNLVGFWTALARVQDHILWMARLSNTRALDLSDDQMRNIFWLHEFVRNEFVHFIPKTQTISIKSILTTSKDVINVIVFLVFNTCAINSFKEEIRERVRRSILQFGEYYEAQQSSTGDYQNCAHAGLERAET